MDLAQMRAAHRVLAERTFERVEPERGYCGRTLYVNLSDGTIAAKPVTDFMKEVFTGGKGFDLYLMWHAIPGPIAWDDPRNELCFSAGPLGGTPAFAGSGKCLVTGISPTTGSVMDSNVGGHFGPLLKFAGWDALEVQGKAGEDVVLLVDGREDGCRVSIESAPEEPVSAYQLSEVLHHMYAEGPEELQSLSVVSAGPGADHTLIGCLNVSFWDWKRRIPRLKQAGRGGLGTVFRNKKLKAIVAKAWRDRPTWTMAVESP